LFHEYHYFFQGWSACLIKVSLLLIISQILTGAWLRTHADDYQPYLEVPLEEYCKTRIDPATSEIEHVGLTALVDLLIKPAGIGAEVLYLDRNVGEEVISYQYEPLDQNGQTVPNHPWFRLLYRP
jgi:ubiquitin thioesterase protein OTUB1